MLHGPIGKKNTHTQVMIEFMVQFELEIVEACKKKIITTAGRNFFFFGRGEGEDL